MMDQFSVRGGKEFVKAKQKLSAPERDFFQPLPSSQKMGQVVKLGTALIPSQACYKFLTRAVQYLESWLWIFSFSSQRWCYVLLGVLCSIIPLALGWECQHRCSWSPEEDFKEPSPPVGQSFHTCEEKSQNISLSLTVMISCFLLQCHALKKILLLILLKYPK